MELIQTAKDDHATGEVSHRPAVGLPRKLRPAVPDATSQNLGWVGLQAFRYRNHAGARQLQLEISDSYNSRFLGML
jgi:hypothetical protein